jgi:hypothetical protein
VLEKLAAVVFREQVPLKHRLLSTKLHSIMFQVRFILTSNLTEQVSDEFTVIADCDSTQG